MQTNTPPRLPDTEYNGAFGRFVVRHEPRLGDVDMSHVFAKSIERLNTILPKRSPSNPQK